MRTVTGVETGRKEVKVITIEEESLEEIFEDQPDLHAPDLEDSVEIEEIAVEEESVEETFEDRPDPHAPQLVVRLELELVARPNHLLEGNARLLTLNPLTLRLMAQEGRR